MSTWRLAMVVLGGVVAAGACSVVNAPDDVEDPNAGAGGVGAAGGSTGGSTDGGGGSGGGDCGALNTLENCGQCGVPCEPDNALGATCATGTCTYTSCIDPHQDCDNDRTNGCESNPATDPENCGGCGLDCADEPFQNVAAYSCENGSCGWSTCEPLFDSCDGNDANGCEHAINTLSDCGDCGVPCQPANADGPTCDTASCDYATCQGAWGDCDNDRANGCETDTLTEHDHCGACNDPCGPSEQCGNGQCSTAQILQNEIPYGNWIYATLDDAPPGAAYGSWINNCQTNYVTMPMGWDLVPEDANIVTNIIAVNTWSTHCILFENGVSYGTPAYGAGTSCGCSGTQCMEQSGNDWHVTSCSRRILIRRPN